MIQYILYIRPEVTAAEMEEVHAFLRSSYMDPPPSPLSTQCRCIQDSFLSLSLSSLCVACPLKLEGEGMVQ